MENCAFSAAGERAADSQGISFVHLIQPNQYVDGSKQYSEEETLRALQWPVREQANRYDFVIDYVVKPLGQDDVTRIRQTIDEMELVKP